jgi:hypothetical protein
MAIEAKRDLSSTACLISKDSCGRDFQFANTTTPTPALKYKSTPSSPHSITIRKNSFEEAVFLDFSWRD